MPDTVQLLHSRKHILIDTVYETLVTSGWHTTINLSQKTCRKIFSGVFTNLVQDLRDPPGESAGYQLTDYYLKVCQKESQLRSNFHGQATLLGVCRLVLNHFLAGNVPDHSPLFYRKFQLIQKVFDYTLISLSQWWGQFFQEIRYKDRQLIQEFELVKNDLQRQLDVVYQIFKESPVGMVGCNGALNVRLWNRTASRLTGYQQADILKKRITQIFTARSQEKFQKKVRPGMKGNNRFQLNIQSKDGHIFPALVSVSEISQFQRLGVDYIISFLDIKGERIIQSHIQRINQLTAIGRLSSAIMHDIRNPINSLGLNVDVMQQILEQENRLSPTVKEWLDKIYHQIERVNESLNQYLGYSRLTEINEEPIDLTAKVNELLTEMHHIFDAKNIQVKMRGGKKPEIMEGDWTQLKRAVSNLLQNAVDAAGEGGTIWVNIYFRNYRVLLSVRDSGPGIEAERINRIFEPYYSTKSSGSGLGLYIVREIVRGHHGRITCTSSPGKGARFTISFPAFREDRGKEPVE